jgi:hypothetical protein
VNTEPHRWICNPAELPRRLFCNPSEFIDEIPRFIIFQLIIF